jgi:catechol 2,3-dioxygenase-like lactoylglutathione lyase family enzyme
LVPRSAQAARIATRAAGGMTMAYTLNHVHLKTSDPDKTIKFYVDNFGATIKKQANGGYQLDLHGLQLNVTDKVATQKHEQHYGIEHIAVNTDDYDGALSALRRNGVEVLEELIGATGKRICFLQCPDGAQMEIIER